MPRIVNWEEFTKLPTGTVFWEYRPDIFYNPGIVVEWIDHGEGVVDFFSLDLDPSYYRSLVSEDKIFFLESVGRWGAYDYDQLFCVLDDSEVREFSETLTNPPL